VLILHVLLALNRRGVRQRENHTACVFIQMLRSNLSIDVAIYFCSLWSSVCFLLCFGVLPHLVHCLAASAQFLRKEVIQPQLPLQLPCYDFVPIIRPAFGSSLLAVSFPTSGMTNSHDVTGGVYKARERIHRTVLMCGY
jgi:hypothetical protein